MSKISLDMGCLKINEPGGLLSLEQDETGKAVIPQILVENTGLSKGDSTLLTGQEVINGATANQVINLQKNKSSEIKGSPIEVLSFEARDSISTVVADTFNNGKETSFDYSDNVVFDSISATVKNDKNITGSRINLTAIIEDKWQCS